MDETKTMVTNISDVDIKGNIPDFVVNSMSKMRVEMLYTLEKKIKEYVEKKWFDQKLFVSFFTTDSHFLPLNTNDDSSNIKI